MLFWHVVAKNTLNNVKHTLHTLTQSYTLMRSLCNTYTKPVYCQRSFQRYFERYFARFAQG